MVTRFEKFKASFWCLFKTFIPLKMFQTFRRAKRPFYKHAWITNWNQILIKKKNFTKRSSIFQHYFEEIFLEEYFKKREIRFFQPSNEYTSFLYLSSKLDNSRFPQGNEKLPRKQEFLDKAVQAVSLSRKRKPSTPSQDLFLPVDPFEPSFSIDFFFFFFFSSFPCSCCVSQRRSFHISRVPTRHGQLFELSTTLKARAKHTRGGRGSIFEPFLRRRCFSFASPGGTPRMGMLETEIENSSDARQGNPWNSSVWLCLEYFCSKDVNLDLIFRLSKNSWNVSHRTIFRLFVEKRKRKCVLKCRENYYWKQRIIHKENSSLRIINRETHRGEFQTFFFLSLFFDARMLNRALPSSNLFKY